MTPKLDHNAPLPLAHNASAQHYSGVEFDPQELGQMNAAWEPPIPLGHSDLPTFPIDALPDAIRDFVIAEAEATQTPPDMAAMLTLSTCSAALAKKFEVKAREGWVEPINLYTVSILESGNRKSAVFTDVTKPLAEYEREQIEAAEPRVRVAQQKQGLLRARIDALRTKAAKSNDEAEIQQLQLDATEADAELAELKKIVSPKFITDDCTSEKLGIVLAEQDGRIACLSPEGGVFDLMAGMYSKSGMPQFGIYLHGHSGDDYRVERVTRSSVWIPRPAITVGLTIQPEVLNGLVNKTAFRGRGLLARFLYAVPKSLLGRRKIAPPPVPQAVRENYRQLIRCLCDLRFAIEPTGEATHHFLELSDAAQESLQGFEADVEPQLGTGGEMELLKDWGGKLAGAVVRIAGILHVVKHCHDLAPWQTPVGEKTMQAAIAIAKYLIVHAEAALELMGADEGLENAKYILQWIKRHEFESFNRRELHQAAKRRFKKPEDLDAPLEVLVSHNIIRPGLCSEYTGPGRPASPTYEVNPAIHSSAASETGVVESGTSGAEERQAGK